MIWMALCNLHKKSLREYLSLSQMLAVIDPHLFPQHWGKFYMAAEAEATILELYWKHFYLMKVSTDKTFQILSGGL